MITIESQGGLGNQLFHLALALELAIRTSEGVRIDTWRHSLQGARAFELPCQPLGVSVVESQPKLLTSQGVVGRVSRAIRDRVDTRIYKEPSYNFDPGVFCAPRKSLYTGYFQSWKYSTTSIHQLRTYFQDIRENTKWVSDNKSNLDERGPWFSVHIRLGDYLSVKGQKAHGNLSVEYYAAALKLVTRQLPEARPVVFSDDPESALRFWHASFPEVEVFNPDRSGTSIDNLLLMSSASAIVTANSSFSWWAARIGEDESRPVCAPSNWYPKPIGTPPDLLPISWNVI